MKAIFISLFLSIFACLNINAAKAYPFPIQYKQADGTTVTVRLHGNEHFHYMTTLDGVLVVNINNNIYVARVNDANEIVATDVLAHNAEERTSEELAIAETQDLESFISRGIEQENMLRAKPIIPGMNPPHFPHIGNPRVLVFLADFADCKFSVGEPVKNFRQFLNGEGHGKGAMKDFYTDDNVTFHESHIYGSVAEYFDCMSYGKFRPKFEVMDDIIHLTKNVGDYGSSENMTAFLKDVCTEANKNEAIDFSQFDEDNDGYCDLVYIIFAGQSENVGGAKSTIWAKSGWLSGCGPFDGKYIAHYGVSGELGGIPSYIDGIGVFCHEFSHAMGLPDFYNTANTNDMSSNQGMEYWSVLDWGMYLYNGLGSRPCPYTAWERYDMGWIDIPTIKEDGHYTVYPREQENQCAYIIENPENDDEYLVLESVQKKEWGTGLFGHGLMVTHVNFDSNAFNVRNNFVNVNSKHPRMTVIPADGDLLSTNNAEYMDELRNAAIHDLFCEANGATELSRESNLPNFDWFTNATYKQINPTTATYPNHTRIFNIKENADGSIEFDVTLDTTTGIADVNSPAKNITNKAYNLNGQEVGKNFRGIVVKNGKKYIK